MTTIGTIELIAKIDTSQYKKGAAEIDNANKDLESSSEKASGKTSRAWVGVAKVGLAAVAAAAVAVGVAIVSNVDNAIKRVDTLNNSARTFENLGFNAKDVSKAMSALDKSIRGLPTPLDEAVRGVQMISGATNDVGKSQKIFSSLNNAIIGFGGSSEDVSGAVMQLSQAFSNGRIDAQTWNSMIQNNLGPALNAIARQMGITTGQLKDGLSDGTISVEQFQDSLIKMNTEGGGGMKSFEKIAKDATSGIGTSWDNMQTAITRGIASVIEAIGQENIAAFVTNIGRAFETGTKFAITGIDKMKQFFGFIKDNQETLKQLVATITILLIPAIIKFGVQSAISFATYIAGVTMAGIQSLIAGARMAAAWLLALGPIGLIVAAVAAAVFLIIKNWDTIKNAVSSVFEWIKTNWPLLLAIITGPIGLAVLAVVKNWDTIKGAASSAFDWVKNNWPLLLAIITGPIGLAVLAIIRNFDTIKTVIGNVFNWIKGVFSTIGEIGAGIVKGAINSVLGFAERTINGFIRIINGAINAINKLPGVSVGKVGEVSIPKLAKGGIITSPTLAMIGEGGESEAVIPLSKLDQMLNDGGSRSSSNPNVTVNIDMQGIMTRSKADEREIAKSLFETINQELRAKGQPEIGGGVLRRAT